MKSISLRDIATYRAAEDKLAELNARQRELVSEEHTLRDQLNAKQGINDEVEAMLSGTAVATAIVSRDAFEQVQRQLYVVGEAISRQRRAVDAQRAAASKVICQRVRPQYQAIVKRMAAILAALREVAIEERELRDALCDNGVGLTNEFILPYQDTGEPETGGERFDSIARWETEAREAGMI